MAAPLWLLGGAKNRGCILPGLLCVCTVLKDEGAAASCSGIGAKPSRVGEEEGIFGKESTRETARQCRTLGCQR